MADYTETRAWGVPDAIARFPSLESRIYAIDDRPPLRGFRFWVAPMYSPPIVYVKEIKPVRWIENGSPLTQDDRVVLGQIHCGPAAPAPEVPTPEQILDSALQLTPGTDPGERNAT